MTGHLSRWRARPWTNAYLKTAAIGQPCRAPHASASWPAGSPSRSSTATPDAIVSPIARAYGLMALTLTYDRISAITWFGERSLLAHFGLPRTLPE